MQLSFLLIISTLIMQYLSAAPISITKTQVIKFKYTACQMNGSDLDAYFGDQKKLDEGYTLHFKISDFNQILKDHPHTVKIDVSKALRKVSLDYLSEARWEAAKGCEALAFIEDAGIYFSLSCKNFMKSKGTPSAEEKVVLEITRQDNLVCFPNR